MARLAAVESRGASHRRQMRPPRDPRDRPASPKSPPAGARAPLSERRRAHVCPRLSIPNSSQVLVAQKVAVGVYKGVTTSELDELAAETAASMTSKHPDYAQVSFHARMTHRARRTRVVADASDSLLKIAYFSTSVFTLDSTSVITLSLRHRLGAR